MFKNFLNEFKAFALRGNMIDMAVGIVIGAAFGKIIDSLVKDIIMPPLGMLLGKTDFTNLYFLLKDGPAGGAPYPSLEVAKAAGAVTVNIGLFVNTLISFTIIALSIFLVLKAINQRATTKKCPYCLMVIDAGATKCPFCTADLNK